MSPSVIMADLTCRTPQYDRRLAESIRAAGCPVDVWAAGCYSEDLYSADFDVTTGCLDIAAHLPGLEEHVTKRLKAVEYVANFAALCWRLIRKPPDVLHIQWLPLLEVSTIELTALRYVQQRGTRVVYTVHDLLPLDAKGTDADEQQQRFEAAYRQVDALICHTKTSKRRLQHDFGVDASKIWHIPHGPLRPLSSTGDADGVSESLNMLIDDHRPTVLLFGVLRPYKGYDFLLKAWPEVRRRVEDARLVIVGRAGENVRGEIEDLVATTAIGDSVVRVYEYVSDAQLAALLERADVLAYPYRNITQSGALFTGMGTKTAIVATDVGGLGETIRDGETGRLVSFGDQSGLADTLVELLQDPERRAQLGRAAHDDLKSRLSWQTIARKTIECYQAIATQSRPANHKV